MARRQATTQPPPGRILNVLSCPVIKPTNRTKFNSKSAICTLSWPINFFRVQGTEYLFKKKKPCRAIFAKCWSRGKVIKPCKLEGENGFWRREKLVNGRPGTHLMGRALQYRQEGRGGAVTVWEDGSRLSWHASGSSRTSPSKAEPLSPSGRAQWMLTHFWKPSIWQQWKQGIKKGIIFLLWKERS